MATGGTMASGGTMATGGSTAGAGGSTSTGGTGGTTTGNEQPYPPGPYGYDVGSTIANYAFVGFPAPNTDSSTAVLVHLGDFYNPSGQGTYPAGSPYGAGAAMPKALLLDAGAVWAGPSNYEADTVLPGQIAVYGTCLLPVDILMDGPTPGIAATLKNASNWAIKYPNGYPIVIDPAAQLSPIFPIGAYPINILIDTQTMTIVDAMAGVPDDAFFQTEVGALCP